MPAANETYIKKLNMDKIIEILYKQYCISHAITTDTRTITPGCIFFAFKGETFDGNAYAAEALKAGAALCVIANAQYRVDDRCIVVDDVLQTLQQLALHHRRQMNIPVIGITGTNGKTTTKELTRAVLAQKYRVHATAGNYNNHLGVPLTLLSMPQDTQIAIVEMGANHPGEIESLCSIALPTCGLITSVGKAHLEGFGSFEGVVRTKTELYRHLSVMGGTIYVNADNEVLMDEAAKVCTLPGVPSTVPGYVPSYPQVDFDTAGRGVSLVTYGASEEAMVKGAYMSSTPYMRFYIEQDDTVYTIQSQLLGKYNYDNAMAAAAVGLSFGVEPFLIKEAIEGYAPANNRSQLKKTERNTLFMDCYNANPTSMKAALESFEAVNEEHKIVILGGMRELGRDSVAEHRTLVDHLAQCHFERVLLVGEEFGFVKSLAPQTCNTEHFDTTEQLIKTLSREHISDATILIKGSNSNHLWQLAEVL